MLNMIGQNQPCNGLLTNQNPYTIGHSDFLLAWLFFKEKKSRYCHHSGVVVVGVVVVVVVVTNFNLGYNFISVVAIL